MSDASRPSLAELAVVFTHLADRVVSDPGPTLAPIICTSLRRAVVELECFIPGLDPPPDAKTARILAVAAAAAMERSEAREALARALRGLAFAPHHPELHYIAASACFELGAATDALLLLGHVLWIHPGHEGARRDLESLSMMRGPRVAQPSGPTAPPRSTSFGAAPGPMHFDPWAEDPEAADDPEATEDDDWPRVAEPFDSDAWPHELEDDGRHDACLHVDDEDRPEDWVDDDLDEDLRAA
jgi:hypothetical protein